MICPKCQGRTTRVIRPETKFDGTHRKVECKTCGHKFETLEVAKKSFERVELQHYEERTRRVLAEIRALVESVQPVAPKRNR